jgi:hypothetical protein
MTIHEAPDGEAVTVTVRPEITAIQIAGTWVTEILLPAVIKIGADQMTVIHQDATLPAEAAEAADKQLNPAEAPPDLFYSSIH